MLSTIQYDYSLLYIKLPATEEAIVVVGFRSFGKGRLLTSPSFISDNLLAKERLLALAVPLKPRHQLQMLMGRHPSLHRPSLQVLLMHDGH